MKSVVAILVDALLRELDPVVQEEIAHSLSVLIEYGTVPLEIVPFLAKRLPELAPEAAEHITDVLEAATWSRSRLTSPTHISDAF